MILDLGVVVNLVAAFMCAVIAVITWRRRAHNVPVALTMVLVMAGGCWWAVALAVETASTSPTVAAYATLLTFFGPSVLVGAFMCLGLTIARPQWSPSGKVLTVLLVEPVLVTAAALTNPWHQLVYQGVGVTRLTGSADWTYGPLYWADTVYGYVLAGTGMALVAWGWWRAPAAFRGQRLAVLVGAVIPVAINVVYMAGKLGHRADPTPIGFAVTGAILWYAIFRQDLFVFSPVARALILDQLSDAVVVVSPGGRVLDANLAARALLQSMNPWAPEKLVGVSAVEVFGKMVVTTDTRQSEFIVEFPGGRDEYEVRSTSLVDSRNRHLGDVYVARDVTEANALARRLSAAHTQLVRQVETIDLLRANLAEQASRDPLTGLHNRRHLLQHFAPMLTEARRTGGTLAVALFDIDHFKSVNDDYGHLAGDAVLVALAQRIQQWVPAGALVARWGGEEFFVALPGVDAGIGLMIADDLRRRCAEDAIDLDHGTIHCTVSGGVAAYPSSGTTMDELFNAADLAMYEAKNAGRNVVRSAQPADHPAGRAFSLRAGVAQ